MKAYLLLLCLAFTLFVCESNAGMAFPMSSEWLTVDLFNDFNPQIEWDMSNYLTGLAGNYATCRPEDEVDGVIEVQRTSPEGVLIGGIRATVNGSSFDLDSVKGYIANTLPRWMEDERYIPQIANADTVGCSIEIACPGGLSVIACLFTPEFHGEWIPGLYEPEEWELPDDIPRVAMAFSQEEYQYANALLDTTWDSSYFLENLSGLETRCDMVTESNWPFNIAMAQGAMRGMHVEGLVGYIAHPHSIRTAIIDIIASWRYDVYSLPRDYFGCSVVSDCEVNDEMYVVVSCLFGETFDELSR